MDIYVALIKVQDKIYLMASDDNAVQAFEKEKYAVKYFEDGYNACHSHGYTQSMSALLNSITFSPSIVKSPNIEFIKDSIVSEKPQIVQLSHLSGFMKGFITRPGVEKYWEDGIKPRLISEVN